MVVDMLTQVFVFARDIVDILIYIRNDIFGVLCGVLIFS